MNHQPNTPASINEAVADERALFEAHIVAEGYNAEHWLQRWRVGDAANQDRYIKDWVQTAWEAWKKRASLAAPGAAIDAREQEAEAFLRQMASLPGTIIRSSRDLTPQATTNARSSSKWLTLRVGLGFAIMEEHARQATEDEQSPCAKCSSPSDCGRLGCAALASREEAPPASAQVSAELNGAVASLQAAVIFTDQMRAAAAPGEDVTATGVARHAREWLERAARALIDTLSKPATPSEALSPATVAQPVTMTPMEFDDGRKGWYVQNADFYLDIEQDANGKWSAFFRHTYGGEAFADQADAAQPCASQGRGGDSSQVTK